MENLGVKEIVIESYPGFFSRPKYEDKLKISKNWISYKKVYDDPRDIDEDKPLDIKWDYKTDNKEFEALFGTIAEDLLYRTFLPVDALDAPGFVIIVKKHDGTKKEIHFDYVGINPQDDNFQYLCFLIRKMIPQTEKLPFYLEEQEVYDVDEWDLNEFISELEKEPKISYENTPAWVDKMMFNFLERDFEYSKTIDIDVAHNYNLECLSFKEIKAYVTMITREEHFGEGAIAEFVNDGSALRIMNRIKQLIIFAKCE